MGNAWEAESSDCIALLGGPDKGESLTLDPPGGDLWYVNILIVLGYSQYLSLGHELTQGAHLTTIGAPTHLVPRTYLNTLYP